VLLSSLTPKPSFLRFLKLFTEVPLEQVREYEKLEGAALNNVKKLLADEATSLLHGSDCLPSIHATVESLFSGGGGVGGADMESLVKVGFASSKGEAKRLIKGGGARVNDEKVEDDGATVSKDRFENGRLKLSSGKKKHILVLLP
jgi:tyrosyl-tRNA synthetase